MQPIILKGVVTSKQLYPKNEIAIQITSPHSDQAPTPIEDYKFESYANITLRASDLGDPPIGATVEIAVKLS